MYGDQIGVAQLRHGAGLAFEAGDEDRVIVIALIHDLGGHCAAKAHVYAAIDSGHAATSDRLIDSVASLKNVAHVQPCHGFQYGRSAPQSVIRLQLCL